MSWEDNINNRIRITTGDGKVYEPLTMLSDNVGSFEFNVSEFEFPEISGTKVDKRLRKGVRYPLVLYFQGENCIIDGKAFIESSNDTRPWDILHPIFGQFKGHPLGIDFDNSGINVFKISCTVVETILDDGVKTVFSPSDNAVFILNKSKETNVSSFNESVTSFETTDVTIMSSNTDKLYKASVSSIVDQDAFNEYFNLFNKAQTAIDNALFDAGLVIQQVQNFINYPANFSIGVKNKVNMIKQQANSFLSSVYNLSSSYNEKKIFENNKGEVINTLIQAITTPQDGDYDSAMDVLFIIEQSISIYNQFIDELQGLQSPDGYQPGSYLPDAEFLESLSYSFNYAVSNLFEIALNAGQERTIILEDDSNVVLLTHRFYGLEQDDSTLNKFISTNNITLDETIQIKKGRKIVYYVQ